MSETKERTETSLDGKLGLRFVEEGRRSAESNSTMACGKRCWRTSLNILHIRTPESGQIRYGLQDIGGQKMDG